MDRQREGEKPHHTRPDGPRLDWNRSMFGPDYWVTDKQMRDTRRVADGTQTDAWPAREEESDGTEPRHD
jgi:hypothetical protein